MSAWLMMGDCLEQLRLVPDDCVDAVVTDPPYGLEFMGKKWDYDVPPVDVWAECLRVLKPGGHLLAFAGTRTQHRMAVRIEDAGFEIRDMIAWVYGSGFPKSLDVSKAIDKAAGAAREWQGWGTALKPALEPITVARKPFPGTVADNVQQFGTGAINIDGCRVATDDRLSFGSRELGDGIKYGKCVPTTEGVQHDAGRFPANLIHDGSSEVLAGFPDSKGQLAKASTSDTQRAGQNAYGAMSRGSNGQEPRGDSGSAARFFYCAKASKADRDAGLADLEEKAAGIKNGSGRGFSAGDPYAQVMRKNTHPTVKPTDLMRYLCRLVTRPGGVVLDPYMGSGSTGRAARLEGFQFIGIERDSAYFEIASRRVNGI